MASQAQAVEALLGAGATRTIEIRLAYYSNPRTRYSGLLFPGDIASIGDGPIRVTNKADVATEVTFTQGIDDQGAPVYQVSSTEGEVELELPDPNTLPGLEVEEPMAEAKAGYENVNF
jgi:hypothetical protein